MATTNPERDPMFRVLLVLMAIAVVVMLGFDAFAKTNDTSSSTVSETASPSAAALVQVTLAEFSISPDMIQVPADTPSSLAVKNEGQAPHQLAVTAQGKSFETPMLDPGASATLRLPSLAAGNYKAICTVPGHDQLGMTAMLMVGTSHGTTAGSGIGDGSMATMSADQMAKMHEESMKAFPATTAGAGNQLLKPTMKDGVKIYHLTASAFPWEVSPGQTVEAFGYDHQVPGPQIRVHQGDRIRVILVNELPEPTVIHWHGVTVPNAMDGVPYVTQDPVMPGESFTYEFTVKYDPGTYMYHSHFNSNEQVSKGLYGSFVVEPDHAAWDAEFTEFLNDGPLGYTINGKGWPATAPLTAKRGQTILVRMENVGSMLHPFHLHGYHFTVMAQDGMALAQPYEADTVVVAPGETYDLIVHTDYPGVWAFHCHILSHVEGPQGMFGMATALIVS